MRTPEYDEMSDVELREMLALWVVPDPPESMRERVFGGRSRLFSFVPEAAERPWYRRFGGQSRSTAAAFLMQIGAVAVLSFTVRAPIVRHFHPEQVVQLMWHNPKAPAIEKKPGGGGGGQHARERVTKGVAPQFAPKQFIAPALKQVAPKLPVVPTITARAPEIEANDYGDPLSKLLGTSGGPGANGLGSGCCGGVGDGGEDGYGPGRGGTSGYIYTPGGDVSNPVLIHKVDPEFSEEARRVKYSGTVLIALVVDTKGVPRELRVVRSPGLGLDEKAIAAVSQWRFRPGMRRGRAVNVSATVEVTFRLL